MGTKSDPGKFDCYAAAEDDEPMFVLLGRDRHGAQVVRYWVSLRLKEMGVEFTPEQLADISQAKFLRFPEKCQEALDCAIMMEGFRKSRKGG